MNSSLLQTQLQLPYRRDSWFAAGGLLSQLLPGKLERFAQPVVFSLTAKAQSDVATGFRQLGRAVLPAGAHGPERIIALHEIDVAAGIDLLRNRVALRQLIVRGIDEVNAHAVLAFFVQPNVPAYRLTYAARESVLDAATLAIERRETATRRFTYVLGPGHSHRTAALRLAGLATDRANKTLADVTAAFAVESLSKEFFDAYRRHYQAFCAHLLSTDAPKRIFGLKLAGLGSDEKARDRALKPVRDFVKKLLGRLVFLHFLQKKGWLGCPANRSNWTGGDADFIHSLFQTAPHPDRFHSERLVPLFFDTLNHPGRKNDLFSVTGTRVPYLNGGLFERDFARVAELDFPAPLFAALLDFFGQYHFTIDENDPEDHEIGIDPEMLGHIFENLLEDNKDKGAYYTPKAVVHYMARQSLVHALAARFPSDAAAKDEIAVFIRDKDPVDPKSKTWIATHATTLAAHLDDLRICDPAIGSGAFPIGLLNEIYWAKLALNPSLPRAEAKRSVIQRSIHGVDIDAGAVEIARLRFWLALIVDEPAPVPLPNLDYQIMQGNSLLESFEGEPLDDLDAPTRYGIRRLGSDQNEFDLGTVPTEIVEVSTPPQQALAELRRAYFACHDPAEKSRLRAQIDAAVLRAIDDRLARRRDELEISLKAEAAIARGRKRTASEEKKRAAMQHELAGLGGKSEKLHALLADPHAERPFFLWHLWFRHVLAAPPDGRDGFDIVIGNPPYGLIKDNATLAYLSDSYTTCEGRIDIYEIFCEQALRLARTNGGKIVLIIPSPILTNVFCQELRKFLLTESNIDEITNFGLRVFEDPTVHNCIIGLTKTKSHRTATAVRVQVTEMNALFRDFDYRLPQQELAQGPNQTFDIFVPPSLRTMLARIESSCSPLSDLCFIRQCIKTGDDDKYVISSPKRLPAPWKPSLRGKSIGRYETPEGDLYVKFGDWLARNWQNKSFYEVEKIAVRETGSRIVATLDLEHRYFLSSLYAVYPKDPANGPPLKYLLGVINSTFATWYVHLIAFGLTEGAFTKIRTNQFGRLPIPHVGSNGSRAQELITLVDRILAAKHAGDAATVEKLETEIDAHVYRLYGLTQDEIALIESRPAAG